MVDTGNLSNPDPAQREADIDLIKSWQDVAAKLGVAADELTDSTVMGEVREDLKIGGIYSLMGSPKGIEAKHHISELLGIDINSLKRFRHNTR